MENNDIIHKTKVFVKSKLSHDDSGHDWSHVYRVYMLAKKVTKEERANELVVELAGLLHDIGEHGPAELHTRSCADEAKTFLISENVPTDVIDAVYSAIITHSWSDKIGKPQSLEAKIIADCDALDASGAIGICRSVAYYTSKKLPLHDPMIKPNPTFQDRSSTMVNHFYEKLLLLESTMHTDTCRKLARKRVAFMQSFLDEFLQEWEGKK